HLSPTHRDLPSFPTRRSSDLVAFLLARLCVRTGDAPRAARLLEEFLDANPDHPWAVGYLGQIEAADGRAERSRLLTERYTALTGDRKSTRLNSSHVAISYAVF